MFTNMWCKALLTGVAFGTAVTAAGRAGAYPATVVGSWGMVANQYELTLSVTQQVADGPCSRITGTIAPEAKPGAKQPISGFYCRSTGAVSFVRKHSGGTNLTYQVYSATLGDDPEQLFMAGTFLAYDAGVAGEYPFVASR